MQPAAFRTAECHTGVSGLDRILMGSIRSQASPQNLVIKGAPGTGKTVLAANICCGLCATKGIAADAERLKPGRIGLYLTVEEDPCLIADMVTESFGWTDRYGVDVVTASELPDKLECLEARGLMIVGGMSPGDFASALGEIRKLESVVDRHLKTVDDGTRLVDRLACWVFDPLEAIRPREPRDTLADAVRAASVGSPELEVFPTTAASTAAVLGMAQRIDGLLGGADSPKEMPKRLLTRLAAALWLESLQGELGPDIPRRALGRLLVQLRRARRALGILVSGDPSAAEWLRQQIESYVASAVIKLTVEDQPQHRARYLEVVKWRNQPHLRGAHNFAIVSRKSPEGEAGVFERIGGTGINVYLSVPGFLAAQGDVTNEPADRRVAFGLRGIDDLMPPERIESGTTPMAVCTALVGESGCLKTVFGLHAVAATCRKVREDGPQKFGLVVSFRETEARLRSMAESFTGLSNVRFIDMRQVFAGAGADDNVSTAALEGLTSPDGPVLVIAHIPPGFYHPSQFLCVFESVLERLGGQIAAVLVDDLAQIEQRYPLLGEEEAFVAALIELLKTKGIHGFFVDHASGSYPQSWVGRPTSHLSDALITFRRCELLDVDRILVSAWRGHEVPSKATVCELRSLDVAKGERELTVTRSGGLEWFVSLSSDAPKEGSVILALYELGRALTDYNRHLRDILRLAGWPQGSGVVSIKAARRTGLASSILETGQTHLGAASVTSVDEPWCYDLHADRLDPIPVLDSPDDSVGPNCLEAHLPDVVKRSRPQGCRGSQPNCVPWPYYADVSFMAVDLRVVPHGAAGELRRQLSDRRVAWGPGSPNVDECETNLLKVYRDNALCRENRDDMPRVLDFAGKGTETLNCLMLSAVWDRIFGHRAQHTATRDLPISTLDREDVAREIGEICRLLTWPHCLPPRPGYVSGGAREGREPPRLCAFRHSWCTTLGGLYQDARSGVKPEHTMVAPLPGRAMSGGWYLMVPRGTSARTLAWRVVSMLSRPEAQLERLACHVGLPTLKSIYKQGPPTNTYDESLPLEDMLSWYENACSRRSIGHYSQIAAALSSCFEGILSAAQRALASVEVGSEDLSDPCTPYWDDFWSTFALSDASRLLRTTQTHLESFAKCIRKPLAP